MLIYGTFQYYYLNTVLSNSAEILLNFSREADSKPKSKFFVAENIDSIIRIISLETGTPEFFEDFLNNLPPSRVEVSYIIEIARFMSAFPEKRLYALSLVTNQHPKNMFDKFKIYCFTKFLKSLIFNSLPKHQKDLSEIHRNFIVNQHLYWKNKMEKKKFQAAKALIRTIYYHMELSSEIAFLLLRFPFDSEIRLHYADILFVAYGEAKKALINKKTGLKLKENRSSVDDPITKEYSKRNPCIHTYTANNSESYSSTASGTTTSNSQNSSTATTSGKDSSLHGAIGFDHKKGKLSLFRLHYDDDSLIIDENSSFAAVLVQKSKRINTTCAFINSVVAGICFLLFFILTGLNHNYKHALLAEIREYQDFYDNLSVYTISAILLPVSINYQTNVTEEMQNTNNCSDLYLQCFENAYAFSNNLELPIAVRTKIVTQIYQNLNYFSRNNDFCHAIEVFSTSPNAFTRYYFNLVTEYSENVSHLYDTLRSECEHALYFGYYILLEIVIGLIFFGVSFVIFYYQVNKPFFKEEEQTISFLASNERLCLLLLEMSVESWNLLTTLFPLPARIPSSSNSKSSLLTSSHEMANSQHPYVSGKGLNSSANFSPTSSDSKVAVPLPGSRIQRKRLMLDAKAVEKQPSPTRNVPVNQRQGSTTSLSSNSSRRHVNLKDTKISVSFIDDFTENAPPLHTPEYFLHSSDTNANASTSALFHGTKLSKMKKMRASVFEPSPIHSQGQIAPDIDLPKEAKEQTPEAEETSPKVTDQENMDLVSTSLEATEKSNACLARFFYYIVLIPWAIIFVIMVCLLVPVYINRSDELGFVEQSRYNNSQAMSILDLLRPLTYLLSNPDNETSLARVENIAATFTDGSNSLINQQYTRSRCYVHERKRVCNTTEEIINALLYRTLNFSDEDTGQYIVISNIINFTKYGLEDYIEYKDLAHLAYYSNEYSFYVIIAIVWFIVCLFFVKEEKIVNEGINACMHFPHQYFDQLEDAKKLIELNDLNANVIYVTSIIETGEIYSISDNVEVLLNRYPLSFIGCKLDTEFEIDESEPNLHIRKYTQDKKQRKFVYESVKLGLLMCTALVDDSKIVIDKRKDSELLNEFAAYLPAKFAKTYYETGQEHFDCSSALFISINLDQKMSAAQKDPFFTLINLFTQRFPNSHVIFANGDIVAVVIEKCPVMLRLIYLRDLITEAQKYITCITATDSDVSMDLQMENEPFIIPKFAEFDIHCALQATLKSHELIMINWQSNVCDDICTFGDENGVKWEKCIFEDFLTLMTKVLNVK